jgi:hypothetical protein
MTCMKDANLKNAVVKNAYILATTKLDGLDIEVRVHRHSA